MDTILINIRNIRYVIIALACLAMVLWAINAIRYQEWRYASTSILTWLIHVVIYNVVLLFCVRCSPEVADAWSTIVRLHGLILVSVGATTLWTKQ